MPWPRQPRPKPTLAATRRWSMTALCHAVNWTWPGPVKPLPSPAWPKPERRWKSPARTGKRWWSTGPRCRLGGECQGGRELARIDLDNTRVTAPRDGQLGQIGTRLGAYVNSGAQLMALVPDTLWVIANMKETQMANVRIGQPVSFTVDALNHLKLQGHVQQISPATGSEFALLQADNATGNFVKIAQRIPVRITVDADQPDARHLRRGCQWWSVSIPVTRIDVLAAGLHPPGQHHRQPGKRQYRGTHHQVRHLLWFTVGPYRHQVVEHRHRHRRLHHQDRALKGVHA